MCNGIIFILLVFSHRVLGVEGQEITRVLSQDIQHASTIRKLGE